MPAGLEMVVELEVLVQKPLAEPRDVMAEAAGFLSTAILRFGAVCFAVLVPAKD